MHWLLLIAAFVGLWALLSFPLAVVVGRAFDEGTPREADERAGSHAP